MLYIFYLILMFKIASLQIYINMYKNIYILLVFFAIHPIFINQIHIWKGQQNHYPCGNFYPLSDNYN